MSDPSQKSSDEKVWKRRGLFAAGAALVAAVVGKVTDHPVQAAAGGPVLLGAINSAGGDNTIVNTTGDFLIGLNGVASGTSVTGVQGDAYGPSAMGVTGLVWHETAPSVGVLGLAASTSGVGVSGRAAAPSGFTVGAKGESASPTGVGVIGRSIHGADLGDGVGMRGESAGGIAVFGVIPDTSTKSAIPVYGLNLSSFAGPGPGAGGFGVYGLSAKGHGLVGATGTAGGAAVVGATNGVSDAYAGAFYGPVVVSGAFTVFGAKSAAVPHPDGSHRRLYCVESPESWFEDFGKEQLQNGCMSVTIEPDFAAVVDLTDYHVFLTTYGSRDVLTVSAQSRTGFSVEADDSTSQARFSWRIVAKRKDIVAPRFEAVTVPPEPVLPSTSDVPPAQSSTLHRGASGR
jgi:hypothetical protein